jgi:DNA modification methylase
LEAEYKLLTGDCLEVLKQACVENVGLTFLDPPFRQGKNYRFFDDDQPDWEYWSLLKKILSRINEATVNGGALYFMQREKNAEQVLRVIRETGWTFQNLIIWKKRSSAVPSEWRFSKQHQIIVFATKGAKPRVFNKLRIDLPLLPEYKYERVNGVFLTDVWDDIRELTSGYFAGDEAIRNTNGERKHAQQSPIALLLRIILSSTLPGDTVLDPFAGTGTTLVVANQLKRNFTGIEIDPEHIRTIEARLKSPRKADSVLRYYKYYRHTPNLKEIWPSELCITEQGRLFDVKVH